MIPQPENREDLCRRLAEANATDRKIEGLDLSALNRLLEHRPEDMTAKVEAGLTLDAMQRELARSGQWLPVDPADPEKLTIGELLATDASGPRRFGLGTARDYVIGLRVALADGRLVRSGGNVVKNVAGYDLMKLFIGSRGSLGVIVEVTFKLRPLPESEKFIAISCPTFDHAQDLALAILGQRPNGEPPRVPQEPVVVLTPVVFDLHKLEGADTSAGTLVLGFAGAQADVEWQLARALQIGPAKPGSLDYARDFARLNGAVRKIAVLPSRTISAARELKNRPFVARLGNGVIYYVGPPAPEASSVASPGCQRLLRRLKDEFDPKHIFPEIPA